MLIKLSGLTPVMILMLDEMLKSISQITYSLKESKVSAQNHLNICFFNLVALTLNIVQMCFWNTEKEQKYGNDLHFHCKTTRKKNIRTSAIEMAVSPVRQLSEISSQIKQPRRCSTATNGTVSTYLIYT